MYDKESLPPTAHKTNCFSAVDILYTISPGAPLTEQKRMKRTLAAVCPLR